MSHYAKLIRSITVAREDGLVGTAPAGLLIKNVTCVDDGYRFMISRDGEAWEPASTSEDLPAFTDKGSEARAKRSTLRRGKPRMSATVLNRRLVCKVTDEQAAAVEAIAVKEATNVPGLIRKALIERGMPE